MNSHAMSRGATNFKGAVGFSQSRRTAKGKTPLAYRLKEYRYSHGMMNQAALAKLIGISQPVVSQLERGAEPSERTAYLVNKFLTLKKGGGKA